MLLASLLRISTMGREETQRPAPVPLALEDLYRDHFDFVYRQAARLGGPSIDAEDVAQEVFMVVARKLDTFDSSSLITTWLYGITLNVVRSMRRRWRLRRLFESDDQAQKSDVPVRSVDRAEVVDAHRIAYEILDKLAPKKREAFILAEFEGLSCEEIAKLVGTKTETVWSRLHYARREFAERLAARERKGRG
jgi:RNA polymerase sigma-70 factor (ECF subfamily)